MINKYRLLEFDKPSNGYQAICNWIENKDVFRIKKYLYDKLFELKELFEQANSEVEKHEILKKIYYTMGLKANGTLTNRVKWTLISVENNVIYFKLYLK